MALKSGLRRLRNWFVHLLHLDDSAHRIALGAAVGMFVALTPTIGLQMLIVLFLLLFIPGNRVAGLPIVWITNPATAVPIYFFNYRVGVWILGQSPGVDLRREWSELVHRVPSVLQVFRAPVAWIADMWGWLGAFWKAMESVMAPLWLGSVIVGLVAGLVTYGVMYYLIGFYRNRLRERLQRLAGLRLLRARRHAERREAKRARGQIAGSGGDRQRTPETPPDQRRRGVGSFCGDRSPPQTRD